MAQPPIHVWMPNQPQATRARSNAGTLAPRMPKAGRQYTGKGMPYLVPAWPFRIIGTNTMMLARTMVSTACHQFMPSSISDDASMYVGTQAAMATHSAAMSPSRHLRCAVDVGARSGLKYGEAAISPRGSTSVPDEAAKSVAIAAILTVDVLAAHFSTSTWPARTDEGRSHIACAPSAITPRATTAPSARAAAAVNASSGREESRV